MVEFREVTRQGYGGRLGSSIKGVIGGLALFVLSFPLLWMNEGCAVDQYEKIGEAEKAVVSVDAASVDPANEGKLVHLTGQAKTAEKLSDAAFSVSVEGAMQLRRDVQMYQVKENVETRKEKNVGGSEDTIKTYSYDTVWSSSPIDSSLFKRKYFDRSGYPENPSDWPLQEETKRVKAASVGAYSLSDTLIGKFNNYESLTVKGPATGAFAKAKLANGGFFLGADPANPAVGDVKITFHKAPQTVASIMAQQNGQGLGAWTSSKGEVEWLVQEVMTSAQMIQAQRDAVAMMTWILRLVGFMMMFIGLTLVFKPLSVAGDLVPFIGSIVGAAGTFVAFLIAVSLSALVIGVAWVVHRPLVGIPLLLLTVAAIVAMVVLKKKQAAAV